MNPSSITTSRSTSSGFSPHPGGAPDVGVFTPVEAADATVVDAAGAVDDDDAASVDDAASLDDDTASFDDAPGELWVDGWHASNQAPSSASEPRFPM